MLTRKQYKIDANVAPVRISWSEQVIQDTDEGNFYVKLTPHVDWAVDKMTEAYNDNKYDPRKRYWYHGNLEWGRPSTVGGLSPSVLGAMKRNEIAAQGRKIFNELKKEWTADVQKNLRKESNKRRGQRWNKKV